MNGNSSAAEEARALSKHFPDEEVLVPYAYVYGASSSPDTSQIPGFKETSFVMKNGIGGGFASVGGWIGIGCSMKCVILSVLSS
jgi:hypothetical protein